MKGGPRTQKNKGFGRRLDIKEWLKRNVLGAKGGAFAQPPARKMITLCDIGKDRYRFDFISESISERGTRSVILKVEGNSAIIDQGKERFTSEELDKLLDRAEDTARNRDVTHLTAENVPMIYSGVYTELGWVKEGRIWTKRIGKPIKVTIA